MYLHCKYNELAMTCAVCHYMGVGSFSMKKVLLSIPVFLVLISGCGRTNEGSGPNDTPASPANSATAPSPAPVTLIRAYSCSKAQIVTFGDGSKSTAPWSFGYIVKIYSDGSFNARCGLGVYEAGRAYGTWYINDASVGSLSTVSDYNGTQACALQMPRGRWSYEAINSGGDVIEGYFVKQKGDSDPAHDISGISFKPQDCFDI